ncbi:MAG: MlaD family protein [Candidatus Omnitrophota bacterium]
MKFSNEIKSGIVVIAAVAIAVLFFAKTANFRTQKYEVKTFFVYAGNLKTDALVKLSGIEVGRLKKLNFVYGDNTRVECTLEIDAAAKIRKDSIAYVGSAGFVGDAFVGITPGKSPEFLAPDSVIASEDPIQMRELMKKADSIATNLDATLSEVKSLIADNRANIDTMITNFKDISIDVKSLFSDNRQKLDNIVINLESTTKNFEEFSSDVKQHPWKLLFKGD